MEKIDGAVADVKLHLFKCGLNHLKLEDPFKVKNSDLRFMRME